MIRTPRLLLTLTAGLLLSASCLAAPPSDEQIKEMEGKFQTLWEENRDSPDMQTMMKDLAVTLVGEMDLSELNAGHIEKMMFMFQQAGRADDVSARLDDLVKQPNADGAAAAGIKLQFAMRGSDEDRTKAIDAALNHPGMLAAMADGSGIQALGMLGYVEVDLLKPFARRIVELGDAVGTDIEPTVAAQLTEYPSLLQKLGDAVTKADHKRARDKVIGILQNAIAKVNADESADPRLAEHLEGTLKFMNGAFARGELIDHMAPQIDLTWFSGDTKMATLADFKGKIVVLDFWATWCGPCIASFPNMKHLQERYNGYDVVILGVTSLQEKHYPGDGPPVDTEGDPQKEYSLMKEFMASKDMTWPVAFSKQAVFNPDFGVRGIPHVAIVDAKGVVRFNGLHPMDPMPKKAGMIDSLLKEAGLPAPAPLEGQEEKP